MLLTVLKGFSTGGSLIVAIGAQNVFVIRQGLMRRHLFLTALVCSVVDGALIMLGVTGLGHVLSLYPFAIVLAKYFAIVFLFFYGAIALRSAYRSKSLEVQEEGSVPSKKKTVLLLLALSLLNPHVYLDTVILLGSIASQYPSYEQLCFTVGAMSASFVWFFAITYGSRFFAPLLKKPNAWRVIDSLVAITMWMIAVTLCLTF